MKKCINVKMVLIGLSFGMIISCKPGIEYHKLKLLKTDQSFSEYSKNHGMEEAFLEFLADDAVLLNENSMPILGIEEIKKLYDAGDDSGYELTWEPMDAVVASSGDLGYTYGVYTLKGNNEVKQGTYVSIWRIGSDGRWKLVLDTGNEGLGKSTQ